MAEIGLTGTGFGQPLAQSSSRGRDALLSPAEAGAITGEWLAVAGVAAEDNPFFMPGIALTAARHFGRDVRIATVRGADGGLIAVAPVTRSRLGRIAPALRVWAHNYGPLGVPLVSAKEVDAAAAGMISGLSGGASLVVPDLTLDGPVATALRRAAERAGRDVVVLDAHHRAVLAAPTIPRDGLSAKRRKEYGRQMRRLAESGRVTLDAATTPEAVNAAFDEFLALEAKGWKGKRGTALAAIPDKREYAREALALLAASRSARIDALRLDGKAIAMLVTFIAGRTAVTWKIAFDEDFAAFSPGAQIMLDAPPAIFADGVVTRIDSLAAANHPMIDHLWKDRTAIGTLVIGPPGSNLLHRLGLLAVRAEMGARVLAKWLVGRLKARMA